MHVSARTGTHMHAIQGQAPPENLGGKSKGGTAAEGSGSGAALYACDCDW
jgi:hypothetical protein